MKINISNTTGNKFDKKITKIIKKVVKKTVNLSSKKFDEINIVFVKDTEIKKLNRRFLNKNRPTDVIAFNYPETSPLKIADIYISVDTAMKNSKIYSIEFETEIIILSIHGALHITGHTDHTQNQRKKMNLLTLKIIKSIFDKII